MVRTLLSILLMSATVAWCAGGGAAVKTPVAAAGEGEPEIGELISDRPDFTESSEVVGKGVLQIETGIVGERYGRGADGTGGITGPLPLIRLGVSKRFEFRFSGDGYSRQRLLARAARSPPAAPLTAALAGR